MPSVHQKPCEKIQSVKMHTELAEDVVFENGLNVSITYLEILQIVEICSPGKC